MADATPPKTPRTPAAKTPAATTPPAPVPPAPVTPPPAPSQPAAPGPKQTQSLVGFLLGIGSILFSGLGIIGIGLGVAAVIVSTRSKKSEPDAPTWMRTTGLITGIVGIALSVIIGIISVALFLAGLFATSYHV